MHLQAMESFFGFISVLPGAFSAYRWAAIRGSPLKSYFMAEERSLRDLGPYLANLLLAEEKHKHGYDHFGERQLLQNLEVYLVAGSNNFSIFGLSDSHDHWQKVIL